ncbi:MAG: hypothetical protein ACJAXW_003993 [Candidatus Azotimanducaceae bacterium]
MTNANGEFSYIDGESIVFNIGSIEFPSVTAAPQISPLYVFNTSDFNNTQVTNLARLLHLQSHEYCTLEVMVCMDDGGIVEFYTCSKVTSRVLMQ